MASHKHDSEQQHGLAGAPRSHEQRFDDRSSHEHSLQHDAHDQASQRGDAWTEQAQHNVLRGSSSVPVAAASMPTVAGSILTPPLSAPMLTADGTTHVAGSLAQAISSMPRTISMLLAMVFTLVLALLLVGFATGRIIRQRLCASHRGLDVTWDEEEELEEQEDMFDDHNLNNQHPLPSTFPKHRSLRAERTMHGAMSTAAISLRWVQDDHARTYACEPERPTHTQQKQPQRQRHLAGQHTQQLNEKQELCRPMAANVQTLKAGSHRSARAPPLSLASLLR